MDGAVARVHLAFDAPAASAVIRCVEPIITESFKHSREDRGMLSRWRSKGTAVTAALPRVARMAHEAATVGRFEEVVTTREHLRGLHSSPSHRASNKVIDHIDDI